MNARKSIAEDGELRLQILHGDVQTALLGRALELLAIKVTNLKGEPIEGCSIDFMCAPSGMLRRDDEVATTNKYGVAAASFHTEAIGPYSVECWVSCAQGTATITFEGNVVKESEAPKTLPYTETARDTDRLARQSGPQNEARSTRISTILTVGTPTDDTYDLQLDGERDENCEPEGWQHIPTNPLPGELRAEDELLEHAQRASAVSHPDEDPMVPSGTCMRRSIIAVVAIAACLVLWQILPTSASLKATAGLHCTATTSNGIATVTCPKQ